MFLNELYKSYEQIALLDIPNWKDIDVNSLCNDYVKYDDNPNIQESYLAAIVLKYWPRITNLYKKSKPFVTAEDCYDWLIESLLKVLKERPWLDEKSSIFGDSRGPDKAINTVINCTRANFFQALNYDKRKIELSTISYDALLDEYDDLDFLLPLSTSNKDFILYEESLSYFDNLVADYFRNKEYLKAFALDMMINQRMEDSDDIARGIKALHEDFQYINYFSNKFKIKRELVSQAVEYESNLTKNNLSYKINKYKKELKRLIKNNEIEVN